MTNKKLAILAVAAVAMAGWAVLQNRLARQTQTGGLFQSAPLIQGLDPETIAAVTVTSNRGRQTVTLKKTAGRFSVVEKDNYPANMRTLNRLLNSCLDIRVSERITADAANHAALGVTESTAQSVVRFFNAADEEITGVLISETQPDRNGAFVRLTTGDETYFVDSPPWLSTGAMDYIDKILVQAEPAGIRQVTVRSSDGEYSLRSPEGTSITLESMPDGMQFKGTTYRSVFGALRLLEGQDVTIAENAPAELNFDRSYVCYMQDTTIYTVLLARHKDNTYVKLSAEFMDTAPVEIGREDTPEALKQKEAKLLAMDAAEAFTQRHAGWIYTIASSKADELTASLDDLLEPLPEPEPQPEPAKDDAPALNI